VPPGPWRSVVNGSGEEQSVRIELLLPDDWEEIDLDQIDATVFALAGGERPGEPEARALLKGFELQLRAALVRAQQEGAVGMYHFMVITSEEPHLLAASLVVYLRRFSGSLASMRAQLDTTSKRVDDLVGERTGNALRVTEVVDVVLDGIDGPQPTLSARYYLELPDREETAILVFTTPNLVLRDEFVDLFDDVAATFAVVGAGDEV